MKGDSSKESRPKGPVFAFRKFFGVLEYWSDGVVEKLDYSFL
jgi:hypothetical protein